MKGASNFTKRIYLKNTKERIKLVCLKPRKLLSEEPVCPSVAWSVIISYRSTIKCTYVSFETKGNKTKEEFLSVYSYVLIYVLQNKTCVENNKDLLLQIFLRTEEWTDIKTSKCVS